MKVKKLTGGPIPWIIATICSVGISVLTGPIGFITFPLFVALSKYGIGKDIDSFAERDSKEIIRYAGDAGKRSVKVTQTIGSGGTLFNLPMRRRYTATFDD